ncbi:MAG: GNAT family N-acetyltransferase [Sneathiellaceae bacterium]
MTDVTRNDATKRFELPVDGHTAFVDYRQGDGRLLLVHTEVPAALGGKGIGSRLAKGTLDLLRSEGVKVELRCDFLQSYVERHPEYRDLLA